MSSHKKHQKLGEFYSTAICGNDILSSALYVAGIAAIFAGLYAPIVLLCVAMVLFFYKSVYREVVEALPVNGGAYNALLNGTSKTLASIAGVMTILSYIATAVISAKTGVEYLFFFLEKLSDQGFIPISSIFIQSAVLPCVLLILFLFALLVISGVKDSAKVAAGIFVFHIITLASFSVFGIYLILQGAGIDLVQSVSMTSAIIVKNGGLLQTFFLAFSACLLGVSGFESSANFVEEQQDGVFKKTLRNMTLGVLIFNPLIAYVVVHLMSLPGISQAKDFVLAEAAYHMGGLFFLGWVSINAFFVLCGAVLTGYVGVSGLMNRMSLDGCLPSFLLKVNKQESHPRIILTFFLLCASILLVTKGELLSLAGVYTISFLGVMSLFAVSNLILRHTRSDLKRGYHAFLPFVLLALFSTLIGLMGNINIDPKNTAYFLTYFIPAILLVFAVLYKKDVVKKLLIIFSHISFIRKILEKKYAGYAHERLYVFVYNFDKIQRILNYIHENESGHRITLIHCGDQPQGFIRRLRDLVDSIQTSGFFPHFRIDTQFIKSKFSPDTVRKFASQHHVPLNKVFIGSIHEHHTFSYDQFGGVRIIL